MPDPLKPSIMQDFRDALGTNGSPSFFDSNTPPVPVAIIAGNVGYPRPRSNQRLRYTTIRTDATNRQFQVATASATTKIYYVGLQYNNNAAVVATATVWDGNSGSPPSLSGGTAYQEDAGYITNFVSEGTLYAKLSAYLPYPMEMKYGIRVSGGGVGQDLQVTILYIEETVNY